ncbi:MAG: hypothetical protein JNL30_19655 [Rubrivivax sp.]|nr:hypothetical protein [Rubrivivax sp.]
MLLTLASNPVAAANTCVVASSFVSVATFKSRNPTVSSINCATRRVEEWRNACIANASLACVAPAVKDVFGPTPSTYNTRTMRSLLCDSGGIQTNSELGVLQHLIALHLSITQGFMRMPSGNVSQAYLSGVWLNFKANGNQFKVPSTTIVWSSQQLVTWLRYQLNYSMAI